MRQVAKIVLFFNSFSINMKNIYVLQHVFEDSDWTTVNSNIFHTAEECHKNVNDFIRKFLPIRRKIDYKDIEHLG